MSRYHGILSGSALAIGAALAVACSSSRSDSSLSVEAASVKTFSEQAATGKELYSRHCAECHGNSGEGNKAPPLVGLKTGALPLDPPADRKFRKTRFVTVGDVGDFAIHNMPPNRAGSITNDEYWAILAFDLKANGINLVQKLTADAAKTVTIPR